MTRPCWIAPAGSAGGGARIPRAISRWTPATTCTGPGRLHYTIPERRKKDARMSALPTKNDVPSNAKAVAIELLNARVADGIALALVTKQAHWNLRGPQFIAVHEMLDGFRTELDDHVDTMAERVVQLGGTAPGTTPNAAKATKLAPYPTDIHAIQDHLAALIERYGQLVNSVRANIDQSAEAGDADTADIFTGVSRGLDKALWFLEAH